MSDRETSDKFEVRGYTYRFTIGIDEGIFECDRCGSLVSYPMIGRHDHFHSLVNVLINEVV